MVSSQYGDVCSMLMLMCSLQWYVQYVCVYVHVSEFPRIPTTIMAWRTETREMRRTTRSLAIVSILYNTPRRTSVYFIHARTCLIANASLYWMCILYN